MDLSSLTNEIPPRPETFDVWEFVQYCLTYGYGIYARVNRPDEEGVIRLVTLPLSELTPAEWIYWVKRWHMTASTPVWISSEPLPETAASPV